MMYFYTAYHTSSFSPATIDNLTALTGATTIASNSTWGTNSLATWSGTAWSVIAYGATASGLSQVVGTQDTT